MIACIDVNYRGDRTTTACILGADWLAEPPYEKLILNGTTPEAYQSGEFFRRELPPILEILKNISSPLDCIIVDGYVWLGKDGSPGLGGYLYRELGEAVPVIGVAKNRYRDEEISGLVCRGGSSRPLYIPAAGMNQEEAAGHIRTMHGPYRIPTALKEADRLSRKTNGVEK